MLVHKSYKLTESFFYKQRSIDKVCKVLDLSREQFKALLLDTDSHYRIKGPQPGHKRKTETPRGVLRRVHDRLQTLLYRIEVPVYASALRRDVNYADNARVHGGDVHVLKTDIAGFYPSVKRHHVQHFLSHTLKMELDLAAQLSRIMTVSGSVPPGSPLSQFVPTGSPLSQTVSFWAMYPMFQRLAELADANGAIFTVWVDDLVFSSSKPISKEFLSAITQTLKAAGMKPKYKKTILYGRGAPKKVTGTILNPAGEARVPNALRQSIVQLVKQLEGKKAASADLRQRLISKINAAQTIEREIFKDSKARAKAIVPIRAARKPPRPPRQRKIYPKVF